MVGKKEEMVGGARGEGGEGGEGGEKVSAILLS